MESRGWLLFVTGSILMAILQVDCVVQEYELYNISRTENYIVTENETNVPRSTVRTMHLGEEVASTDSPPELSTRIAAERPQISHSSSFYGIGGVSTQTSYLTEDITGDTSIDINSSETSTTITQMNITHLPLRLNTEENESPSNSNATPTRSSTLNDEVTVTNSSVTLTPEIADNTLFNIRESSTQYLGSKSSNDNEVSFSDNASRPLIESGNFRNISYSIDDTYSITNSEVIIVPIASSTSSSSLRDVSQPEETTSNNMISTVPLNEYRQSASVTTPTITNFSNSTVTSDVSTEDLTSFNEITTLDNTVNTNYPTKSHAEESKNESFHGSFTTEQQSVRVQCNNSSDCQPNEVCLKSYDGKSYCDCNQTSVRDNISGACLEDSLNSPFQLLGSTEVTFAPSADTTDFSSRSTTRDFTQTHNTSVTFDEMNFTVPDQVKNVEDSKPSSRDSNGLPVTLNHEENVRTKIFTAYDSSTSPSMSYQEEISRESGSTLETTEDSFNSSLHNQDENIDRNYTMSNATHDKPRTTDEGINISSSFTEESAPVTTTPPNGDANELQTGSTNAPTQGVVFDVRGKSNCSSQTIQSKQFDLKSWNNLSSEDHSIHVLSIQLPCTLNLVEWFHTYDYPFRTFIANVLAEENAEDRVNGAQNVIYIAPTPLTDGQRISICFVVASVNQPGHYLNASDAVKMILRERNILDKEVHLQISSASVGCPSEYREKYIKCKIAHVPPLAVAISIIVAMVVLVLILIVLLYMRRHKHHRHSYKPNLSHRKWHDARYCQTGQNLSTDIQCTEDEFNNHLHGGGGDDGVVPSKTKVSNKGQNAVLKDSESKDQEEFLVVIHDNKIGGIETDTESQFEDTTI